VSKNVHTNATRNPMQKYFLTVAAALFAIAITAPVAQAQTEPFSTTYTLFFGYGHQAPCPNDAFACGNGSAPGFGAFTEALVGNPDGTITCTLIFADGSTLVLDETVIASSNPGASAYHQPPHAAGHAITVQFDYTVVGGSGSFADATGSGIDNGMAAGNVIQGAANGAINLSGAPTGWSCRTAGSCRPPVASTRVGLRRGAVRA
jgi:hypothetical protein